MTDTSNAQIDERVLSGELAPVDFSSGNRRSLLIGGIVILVIIAIAAFLSVRSVEEREKQFTAEMSSRLGILASGRAEIVTTWLEGVLQVSDRVTGSDFFRLFATEADLFERDEDGDGQMSPERRQELEAGISEQLPLMTNVLSEFVQNTEFMRARVLSRKGQVYISTDPVVEITEPQRDLGMTAIRTGKSVFAPVRASEQGLILDFALPLFPPQDQDVGEDAVSSVILSLPVNNRALQFIEAPALARAGEKIRLLQVTGSGVFELSPGSFPPVVRIEGGPVKAGETALEYGERQAIGDGARVFSVGSGVASLNWMIVLEADSALARADIDEYRRNIYGIAALAVVVVLVAFGAFWWKLVGDHNKALATQFQRLAAQINTQRKLLDGINNTIADHIGLKDRTGKYVYANPALAEAVSRDRDELIGLDDAAIYGRGTAERLAITDEEAISQGRPVTTAEKIFLEDELHHLQISKVPLTGEDGEISGIVSVTRDITELVQEQERREKAVRQTVVALVRAIELRDPYLAGHSRRVAGFAGLIARRLGASDSQQSTVEIAANLSQIGKLSISRALLTKPERLTPEEVAEIQNHVEHAASVLRDVDFGLPVFETIYQMNERLDGAGYPKGLEEEDISLEARILGACDVFCARIAPRVYRPSIPAEEAIQILEGNTERYDRAVIEALRTVVSSRDGERLLADLTE
jgi:PAS domain S-box-containing protein